MLELFREKYKYLILSLISSFTDDGTSENCSDEQFQCGEGGKCIPKRWQCDYHKDCEGGEDEYDCRKYLPTIAHKMIFLSHRSFLCLMGSAGILYENVLNDLSRSEADWRPSAKYLCIGSN